MNAAAASALLFDLDGTLVDTAPDLHAAVNAMRAERGIAPLAFSTFRPQVSRGGKAMLGAAFPGLDDAARDALIDEFLARYRNAICVHTALFDGIAEVLDRVESSGLPWGIVTNKPGWLCAPLLPALGLDGRYGVLIAGDSLPVRKPDPGPVVAACAALDAELATAVFVGDDERDVQAGRAAGCRTVVAGWGYVPPAAERRGWGADLDLDHPRELLDLDWLALRR